MSAIDLKNELLHFTLKLYNNPCIPRNVVQDFIDITIDFFCNKYIAFIKQQIERSLPDCPKKILGVIDGTFKQSTTIFEDFKTEHLRFNLYRKKNLLYDPEEYNIFKHTSPLTMIKDNVTATYIPLQITLKILFEMPGVFDAVMKHVNELKAEKFVNSNFIQGELWKKQTSDFPPEKIVFPLFGFEDDFECGNALGSHAGKNKLGTQYMLCPVFPPKIASKLEFILLNTLYHSNDKKNYSDNKTVFQKLVVNLNQIRNEGITISVKGKKITIFFQLGLMLGDNLGLNNILGFTENFNSGNACRICRADGETIKTLTKEDDKLLRTKETYTVDYMKNNPSLTGVNDLCVFNSVQGFHVNENYSLDIMHDIFEGVAAYAMANICHDFIYIQKLFTLDLLNIRIQSLNCMDIDLSNKIPNINKNHLYTEKRLKMSAAEMLNFSKYFGVLVGDLVSEDNQTWHLYYLLRKIIDIILSPRIVEGHCVQLDFLVTEFLDLYIKLYKNITFKFHNMIHLVRCIKMNGPLILFWSMRYESKHRFLKQLAIIANCKKNLLKTVSGRYLLCLAYMKLTGRLPDDIIYYDSEELNLYDKIKYFGESNRYCPILNVECVAYRDNYYEKGIVIVISVGDNDNLIFGKITQIFVKNSEIYLLLQPLSVVYFDEHCYAYKVEETPTKILKNVDELLNVGPCARLKKDGSLFVIPKHIL